MLNIIYITGNVQNMLKVSRLHNHLFSRFLWMLLDSFSLSEDDDDDGKALLDWGWRCLVTVETPSTNFVRNNTLALLNMPSFRETTMNWDGNKTSYQYNSDFFLFCLFYLKLEGARSNLNGKKLLPPKSAIQTLLLFFACLFCFVLFC